MAIVCTVGRQQESRRRRQPAEVHKPTDRWTAVYLLAVAGHPEKFETLVAGITPWLTSRLLKDAKVGHILQNFQDREDVLQTTFLKAWAKQHLFDPARGRVATWLYAIARNAAVSLWRKRRRCATVRLEEVRSLGQLTSRSAAADPESSLRTEDLMGAIERAVAAVQDPVVREALCLRLLEGKKYREISEQLAIPVGSLGRWVHVVRARLRNNSPRAA